MGLIIVITIVLCFGLFLGFYKGNQRMEQQAASQHSVLEKQLATHKAQIVTRQLHLDRYHFLRYNLQEALQPQPEIKI